MPIVVPPAPLARFPASYFQALARYHAWANDRLHAACAELDAEDWSRARAAFFGSIVGTMNHLLVTQGIWMARLTGGTPPTDRLDAILHAKRGPLRQAQAALDQELVALADGHDDASVAGDLNYANTSGTPFTTPVHWVLGHLFNHATHHRGQVHGLLSQTPVAPPSMDLIFYLRLADQAAAGTLQRT